MQKYIGICFLFMIAFSIAAQYRSTDSQCVTNPPDFAKLSYDQASEQVDKEERKRICPEYITNLVEQLRKRELSNEKKVLILYLLGEFRPGDANSVEALIENIDLRAVKLDPKTRVRRWGPYPAEEALINIGIPAVNPILNHLPTENNALRRHLMCEVLIQVEGKKGVNFNAAEGKHVTEDQIKGKLAKETNPDERTNLQAALNDLGHIK